MSRLNKTVLPAVEAALQAIKPALVLVYRVWRGGGGIFNAVQLLAAVRDAHPGEEWVPGHETTMRRWLLRIKAVEAPHLPQRR